MPYRSAQLAMLLLASAAMAWLDALLIRLHLLGAAGWMPHVPARLWLVAPLCWLPVALLFAGVARPLARQRWPALAIVLLGALWLFVRAPRSIAAIALFVIATAMVWPIERWWASRRRRIALACGIAIPLVCAALLLVPQRTRSRERAAAPAGAPHVVVAFLDTVRADALRSTPLARGSVVYERAYSTSAWTLPSHVSAVTGLEAHATGLTFEHHTYDLSVPTLAQRFARRGYRTAAVLANSVLHPETGFARGFDAYVHPQAGRDVCRTAPGLLLARRWPWMAASVCNWTAGEVARRAIAEIERERTPLLLLLNFMDAHDPYYTERDCRPPGLPMRAALHTPVAQYRRRHYRQYEAAIGCIERSLERILAAAGPNSVVVLLADHGEQFGEHGLVRHSNSLYTQLLHVPLIVRAPGVPPARVAEVISIAEVPRMIDELLARRTPRPSRPFALASHVMPLSRGGAASWSAIEGRWHYIAHDDGREQLFDLATDPEELHPIPAPDRLASLRARAAAARPRPRASEFRSLGYVQ